MSSSQVLVFWTLIGRVEFVQTSAGTTFENPTNIPITFDVSKLSTPTDGNIYYSVESFEQDVLTYSPYSIMYNVLLNGVTQSAMNFRVQKTKRINYIAINYLVIDPNFIDADCFTSEELILQSSVSSMESPFTTPSTTSNSNMVIGFITFINLTPRPFNDQQAAQQTIYGAHLTETVNSTHFQLSILYGEGTSDGSEYLYSFCRVKLMTIYTAQLSNIEKYDFMDGYIIQHNVLGYGVKTFSNYSQSYTSLLVGLNNFSKKLTSEEITFSFQEDATDPNSIVLKMTSADLYNAKYRIFGVNTYDLIPQCVNKHYPIEREINGSILCHDSCLQGEYVTFDEMEGEYVCLDCPDKCKTCDSAQKCTTCASGYELTVGIGASGGQAMLCQLSSQFFIDPNTQCSDGILGCSKCTHSGSSSQCSECQSGYFLNISTSECQGCSIHSDGCETCNQSHCLSCQSLYTQIDNTSCIRTSLIIIQQTPTGPSDTQILPCTDTQRCQTCLSTDLNFCVECYDENLTLLDGKCFVECGNGEVYMGLEECDDGNLDNLDGCSDQCTLQGEGQRFDCLNESLTNGSVKTKCQFAQPITVSLNGVHKTVTKNELIILLNLSQPVIKQWVTFWNYSLLDTILNCSVTDSQNNSSSPYALDTSFQFAIGSPSQQQSSSQTAANRLLTQSQEKSQEQMISDFGAIVLTLNYGLEDGSAQSSQSASPSLNHQTLSIQFDPSSSGYEVFSLVSDSSISVQLATDNYQIVQYFQEHYYAKYDSVMFLGYFVVVMAYLMLIASIVFGALEKGNGATLMVIEFAGVPQFAYGCIMVIGELNPLFAALAQGLKYMNGLPISLVFDPQTESLSQNLSAVGYESPHIADNCSIIIIMVLLCLGIGAIFKIIALKFDRQYPRKESYKKTTPLQAQIQKGYSKTANCSLLSTFKSTNNIQNNPEAVQKYDQESIECEQQKPEPKNLFWSKMGDFCIANCGLSLLMFFSYPVIVSAGIQFQYANSLHAYDWISLVMVGVIYALYGLMITTKYSIFTNFCRKVKSSPRMSLDLHSQSQLQTQQNDTSSYCQTISSNPNKKLYLLTLFFETTLNGIGLLLLQQLSVQNISPILIYCLVLLIFCKRGFYSVAQQLRVSLVILLAITIQCLFLYRKIQLYDSLQSSEVGGCQNVFSQYIPLTIAIVLFLCTILTVPFVVYSFKKIRCCQLQLQRQKMNKHLRSATTSGLSKQTHKHEEIKDESESNNQSASALVLAADATKQSVTKRQKMIKSELDRFLLNNKRKPSNQKPLTEMTEGVKKEQTQILRRFGDSDHQKDSSDLYQGLHLKMYILDEEFNKI